MQQIINLNLIPKGIPEVVNVSQLDTGRQIQFNLFEGSSEYQIPENSTVVVAGRKADGHVFSYSTYTSPSTISYSGSTITVTTTLQMTACAGESLCQLRISKSGRRIATLNFRMMVQEQPDANGDISDSDIPEIVALAQEQEENAEAWAVGTKNGIPVSSGDPQYHNNAKYHAEHMPQSDWAQTDTSAADFIKNKPTLGTAASKNVPTSGNASSSQVVMGSDTRLTAATTSKLGLVKPDGSTITVNGGTISAVAGALANALKIQARYNFDTYYTAELDFNGGSEKILQFYELPITVTAAGWSGSANSSGYFTNEISLGQNVDFILAITPDIYLHPRATAAKIAAYRQICKPNGYVEIPPNGSLEWGIDGTIIFYAKTKPTVDFDVNLRGIFFTWHE